MDARFEHETLYRDAWSIPISTLAKRYGLSDNGLRKVCNALAIPLPGRGHWAKIAAGHKVPIPPLPPTNGRTVFICHLPDAGPDEVTTSRVDVSLQEQIAFEATPEGAIVAPADMVKPHLLVVATAKAVQEEVAGLQRSRDHAGRPRKPSDRWEPDCDAFTKPSWRDYTQRGVMELEQSALPLQVSIETAERALRIWDALLKACEARGMLVSAAGRQARCQVPPVHKPV